MNYIEELLKNPAYIKMLDTIPAEEKEKILEYIRGTILPFVTQVSSLANASENDQTKNGQ
jgi:hypothetical protein